MKLFFLFDYLADGIVYSVLPVIANTFKECNDFYIKWDIDFLGRTLSVSSGMSEKSMSSSFMFLTLSQSVSSFGFLISSLV